jgi:stage II sporulation protein D
VIDRLGFLQSLGALTVATGGLDVWEPTGTPIRVLVTNDLRGQQPVDAGDGTFAFGGKRWRGAPSTVPVDGSRLGLVTAIDVDQYLLGVIPLELSPSWPAAALQAQAIVARTYALARRTLSRPWDVVADDADQRWGGVDAEAPAASAAVGATRGQVLGYAGGPAAVFYSACCGGHTADASQLWGGAPLPYLRGVPDPYCVPAPDYRWTRSAPLGRALAAFGARIGATLVGADLGAPDDSGRPRTVTLHGERDATFGVGDFRRALGSDVVRSTWLRSVQVDATQAAPALVIEGSGRGHGVGLCQWGARYCAAAGASAAQILAVYFPGTAISGG